MELQVESMNLLNMSSSRCVLLIVLLVLSPVNSHSKVVHDEPSVSEETIDFPKNSWDLLKYLLPKLKKKAESKRAIL